MTKTFKSALFLSASAFLATSAAATPPGFNEPGMGQMPVRAQGDLKARDVQDWWPEVVDLSRLRQNAMDNDPLGEQFDYAAEFAKLDLDAVKADVAAVLTDSKEWWPADYGSYTGLFIRLAGTARAPIVQATGAAARMAGRSASSRSTAGRITATSTRLAACCGR